jgi:hypothetical protein
MVHKKYLIAKRTRKTYRTKEDQKGKITTPNKKIILVELMIK